MQDIIYVTIPLAFFTLCVAYVRGLDRLVRRGEAAEPFGEPAPVAVEPIEVGEVGA